MLTFLLGMATGALVIVIGVLIARGVDEMRDERTLKRSRELDSVREDCRIYTDIQANFVISVHEAEFHKKGKK